MLNKVRVQKKLHSMLFIASGCFAVLTIILFVGIYMLTLAVPGWAEIAIKIVFLIASGIGFAFFYHFFLECLAIVRTEWLIFAEEYFVKERVLAFIRTAKQVAHTKMSEMAENLSGPTIVTFFDTSYLWLAKLNNAKKNSQTIPQQTRAQRIL